MGQMLKMQNHSNGSMQILRVANPKVGDKLPLYQCTRLCPQSCGVLGLRSMMQNTNSSHPYLTSTSTTGVR